MFCFLCEVGTVPKNVQGKGYVWVHLDCLMEMFEIKSDFESVRAILKGERDKEPVEVFLERMQNFDKKWRNSLKLLKEND